jgi:hypothetical protein
MYIDFLEEARYKVVCKIGRTRKRTRHCGRDRFADAEGATAPETLRHQNRRVDNSGEWRVIAPADGITFSGKRDRGGTEGRQ